MSFDDVERTSNIQEIIERKDDFRKVILKSYPGKEKTISTYLEIGWGRNICVGSLVTISERDYNFKGRRLGFNGYSDELKEGLWIIESMSEVL